MYKKRLLEDNFLTAIRARKPSVFYLEMAGKKERIRVELERVRKFIR